MAGLEAARSRGKTPGRPTVMTPDRVDTARAMLAAGTPISRIASTLGVGRGSIYRALEPDR
jgi:DNA invertase Pin-like site-specific DNA recombinase